MIHQLGKWPIHFSSIHFGALALFFLACESDPTGSGNSSTIPKGTYYDTLYHENGSIYRIISKKDSLAHGVSCSYFITGELSSQDFYDSNVGAGWSFSWRPNEQRYFEGFVVEDDYICRTFWDSLGNVSFQEGECSPADYQHPTWADSSLCRNTFSR